MTEVVIPDTMVSKVAVVDSSENVQKAFKKALRFIGDIDDLNTKERPLVIKVGIFNHKKGHHHTTIDVVDAIIKGFNKTPKVYVVESDNYKGKGLERLQIYKELFKENVIPCNLSEDTKTRDVHITDEIIQFSHLLFDPHVVVSTHVLRKAQIGSILKNLLGVIPDYKKARFHKKLVPALLDAYQAINGIDLAVLDGTYMFLDPENKNKKIKTNILIVGTDAVAVEAVGAHLVGLNPEEMPIIQEAVKRGLGEGDIKNIKILGSSLGKL
ncbi:MAG: DUF362 domain-containing protein [Candidatus Methanofastidiosia archaeon]|jgi:uncharacterized protein (DUF362 family)